MTDLDKIRPLFVLDKDSDDMGKLAIRLVSNDCKLINDAEAILVFLSEYKDSPETLRSYVKELERWICGKVVIYWVIAFNT